MAQEWHGGGLPRAFSLSDSPLCLLSLREMVSSGMYRMDCGKPYLSNCFPAKSLLRIPEEGETNPHPAPASHGFLIPPSAAAPSGLVQCALNHSATTQWPLSADPCRGSCQSQSNLHSVSATAPFLYLFPFLLGCSFHKAFGFVWSTQPPFHLARVFKSTEPYSSPTLFHKPSYDPLVCYASVFPFF